MTSAVVIQLVEGAVSIKQRLRRLFVPGSRWTRVNYRFPTKISQTIPPGTPAQVEVVTVKPDAVIFRYPDGQVSWLHWPDETLMQVNFVPTGVEFCDARGRLLSYTTSVTAESEVDDLKAYAEETRTPVELIAKALKDELYDKNWQQVSVELTDEGQYRVGAYIVDEANRKRWLLNGARVAPSADTFELRAALMRTFKAAARRAKIKITQASIEDFSNQSEGGTIDLYTPPPFGDWRITIAFTGEAMPGFWTGASAAEGAVMALPRSRPLRRLLTPEQEQAADEQLRRDMRYREQKARDSERDFEARVKKHAPAYLRWKNGEGPFPEELL